MRSLYTGRPDAHDLERLDQLRTRLDPGGPRPGDEACRAGVPTVTVLTGGYCRDELREAGAAAVFDTLAEAIAGIAERDLLA